MMFAQQSPYKPLLIVLIVAVLAGGLAYVFFKQEPNPAPEEQTFCTQEAKQCPDGSYVGRVGPSCEFAPCPGEQNNELWQSMTDEKTGVSFQYPKELLTEYLHEQDWPPQVQVLDQAYTCTEAGSEIDRAGRTEKRLVDNREYCVTKVTEGAAGSNYTMYAYAFPKEGKTIILTFSLRFVRCENYDEVQRVACEQEREAFDIDGIADRMAQSLRL